MLKNFRVLGSALVALTFLMPKTDVMASKLERELEHNLSKIQNIWRRAHHFRRLNQKITEALSNPSISLNNSQKKHQMPQRHNKYLFIYNLSPKRKCPQSAPLRSLGFFGGTWGRLFGKVFFEKLIGNYCPKHPKRPRSA